MTEISTLAGAQNRCVGPSQSARIFAARHDYRRQRVEVNDGDAGYRVSLRIRPGT